MVLHGVSSCSLCFCYTIQVHTFSVPQILCCGHHHLINGIVIKGVCVKVYMTRYL